MLLFCVFLPTRKEEKPTDFLILHFYTLYSIECLGNIIDICFFFSFLFCCTTQVKDFLFYFILYFSSPLMLFLFFQFIFIYIYVHFFSSSCYIFHRLSVIFFSFSLPYALCCAVCLFDVEILVVRQNEKKKSQQQHKICMKCHKMIFNRFSHSNSVKQLSCVDSCHVALPRMYVYLYSYLLYVNIRL